MRFRTTAVLLATILPVFAARAEVCEDCFAVFVMPDTQHYQLNSCVEPTSGVDSFEHLKRVMQWVCDNRTGFVEESTGKQMEISMLIHLGDLTGTNKTKTWDQVDEAFAILDACGANYLAATGNHDHTGTPNSVRGYEINSGFDQVFGEDRWAARRCSLYRQSCDWAAGEYFLGGGEEIEPLTRETVPFPSEAGPDQAAPGRHRAGLIRSPSGHPFLFIGLENGFDFPNEPFNSPPTDTAAEGDDSAWIHWILASQYKVPTVVFHHSLVGPGSPFTFDGFGSDSYSNTETIWNEVVAPWPQIDAVFGGHYTGSIREKDWNPADLADAADPNQDVWSFFRNYQGGTGAPPEGCGPQNTPYGAGWNVIAVFDRAAGELRVRSVRIDPPAASAPAIVDYDFQQPETVISGFPFAPVPACMDGIDNDGDGLVDAAEELLPGCRTLTDPTEESDCEDGEDNDGDGLVDFGADPGCAAATAPYENPQCSDGIDNDGDGQRDAADSHCTGPTDNKEAGGSCGLGWELVLLVPFLMAVHRRRRVGLLPWRP